MAAIGTITPDVWNGSINGPRKYVEPFTRAGVAGAGLVVGAEHPIPCQVTTQSHDIVSGLTATWAIAEAMIGTIISITDPNNDTWNSTAVLDVVGSIQGAEGDAAAVLFLTWTLLPDSLPS